MQGNIHIYFYPFIYKLSAINFQTETKLLFFSLKQKQAIPQDSETSENFYLVVLQSKKATDSSAML